jgi:hypothetical protein
MNTAKPTLCDKKQQRFRLHRDESVYVLDSTLILPKSGGFWPMLLSSYRFWFTRTVTKKHVQAIVRALAQAGSNDKPLNALGFITIIGQLLALTRSSYHLGWIGAAPSRALQFRDFAIARASALRKIQLWLPFNCDLFRTFGLFWPNYTTASPSFWAGAPLLKLEAP